MTPASVDLSYRKKTREGRMEKCDFLLDVSKGRQQVTRIFTVRNYVGWGLGEQEECSPALRPGVTCSLLLIYGIYSITCPKKGCSYTTEAQHPPQNMDFKSAYLATTAAQANSISLCSLSSPGFQGKRHLLIPAWAPLSTLVWRCREHTTIKKYI